MTGAAFEPDAYSLLQDPVPPPLSQYDVDTALRFAADQCVAKTCYHSFFSLVASVTTTSRRIVLSGGNRGFLNVAGAMMRCAIYGCQSWLWLLFILQCDFAVGASGRITDSVVGGPIQGATVYVVWYYRPQDRILGVPIGHVNGDAQRACGGAAVVRTDEKGDYDVGPEMTVAMQNHETKYWVNRPWLLRRMASARSKRFARFCPAFGEAFLG